MVHLSDFLTKFSYQSINLLDHIYSASNNCIIIYHRRRGTQRISWQWIKMHGKDTCINLQCHRYKWPQFLSESGIYKYPKCRYAFSTCITPSPNKSLFKKVQENIFTHKTECITLQHRTCNCTWFVTICSWCDFPYRPTPPLPRPIWSFLDQCLWGTKSKYNSRNRDSYTFHSSHIPSTYLQWVWRTNCYLDINNNTPYFVFAVLKIHSFLKIYFNKILLLNY